MLEQLDYRKMGHRLNERAVRAQFMLLCLVTFVGLAACSAPPSPTPLPTSKPFPTFVPSPTPITLAAESPTAIPTSAVATVVRPVIPTPTPRASEYDGVDSRSLLSALFPAERLSPNGEEYTVDDDPNWLLWINSRAEGRFTQDRMGELATIVAHEAPRLSEEGRQRIAPWGSFLAIFQSPVGKLQSTQRSYLFPTEISPLAFDVQIDRVTDFDRDGINELMIFTNAKRLGISSTAAFLYQWNDQAFVEIWSAPIGEDNTAAVNQAQYYAYSSEIELSDVNADGLDEILVTTARVDYPQDAQGLADIEHESSRVVERRIYSWGGAAFVLNPALSNTKQP